MKKIFFAFTICVLTAISFASCAVMITEDTVASYVDDKKHYKILFHNDGSYEFNPISSKAPAFLISGYYEGDPRVDGTVKPYFINVLKQKVYREPFEIKDGKFSTVIEVQDGRYDTKKLDYVFIRKYARID